ncbi:MoaD/ThiS family protein [bacterium]|nr:MoaD/ThiS family protein [bacterium]
MSDTIRINVLCFSHVREALGRSQFEVELPAPATAADALARVRDMAGTRLDRLTLRVSVNREYAPLSTPLADGDEVALIPPVQGGAR